VDQHIEFVGRDRTGITVVVTSAGVLDVQAAVEDIRSGRARFVAGPSSFDRVPVTVREVLGSSYLYANWDSTRRNNLHDLAEPFEYCRPRTHLPVVSSATTLLRAVRRFRPSRRARTSSGPASVTSPEGQGST
jgi:hypothetical protein